jgi:hypothetical protein
MIAVIHRSPAARLGALVALVAFAAVAWYLVSPLFLRTSLVEPRPETEGPAAAAPLKRGHFNELDAIHRGRGQAQLYRLPDGRLRVQLEAFSVTNGPDLHVFLSRHAAPAGDAQAKDGLLLGALKASEGAFGYETDAPADPAEFGSVVVHCVRFRTVFSFATLS